tara:strand:- start:253 stop:852 length:600 start_codon:yes stop_codon:yes gene_type:complete
MAEDYLQKFASPGFYSPNALGTPPSGNRRVSGSTFSGDVDFQAQEEAINRYEKNVEEYNPQTERILTTEVDTVDESVGLAAAANQTSAERAKRDRGRYGVEFNAAQTKEENRLNNFAGQRNLANASNMARRSDESLNDSRLQMGNMLSANNLSNFIGGLLQYGQASVNKKNAYQKNRNAAKKSQYGFLGNLGSSLAKLI